jgi:hypothetical protein
MRRSFYIFFALILIFAIIVIVWLFFFAGGGRGGLVTPPTNPFPESGNKKGFLFLTDILKQDEPGQSETEVTLAEEQILFKLWDKPVAGYGFTDKQVLEQVASTTITGTTSVATIQQVRATSSVVLFVDRLTGYIHQYNLKTKSINQVSSTLVPGVQDALFFSNGAFVVYRVYEEKKNSVVSMLYRVPNTTETSASVSLEKIFDLPDGVVSLATNKSGKQVSFVVKTTTGGMLYVINEEKNDQINPFPQSKWSVVPLPLSEWNLSYGGNILYMTPKASAYVPGYTLEAFSGKRVISNKTGLVSTPSPDENTLISSMWSTKGLVSFLFNKKQGQTIALSIKTVASKCVFQKTYPSALCGVPKTLPFKKEGLPDDWYQGTASFSDSLYSVYPDGESYQIINLEREAGEIIDLEKPTTNQNDSILLFTNKVDGSLWLGNLGLLGGD